MARGLSPNRGGAESELADARAQGLHRTHIALLAQSRHRAVREAIAKRDDLPLGIQAALANDDWHEVRATVAANPRIAGSILDALADDRHHLVLLSLLSNDAASREAVRKLESHKRPDVRIAAQALTERLSSDASKGAARQLAEDGATPELRERAATLSEAEAFERDAPPAFLLGASIARRAGEADEPGPKVAPHIGEPDLRDPMFTPEPGVAMPHPLDAERGPALRRDPAVEYLVVSLPPDDGQDALNRPVVALATRIPSPPPRIAAAVPSASRVFRVSATI